MAKSTKSNERPVIVTTEYKGVFFGYAEDTDGESIRLRAGRLCLYWSTDTKGFMGLANGGHRRTGRWRPTQFRPTPRNMAVPPSERVAWPWRETNGGPKR